jgi:D-sedoheptulose 7-phosphate isomerase
VKNHLQELVAGFPELERCKGDIERAFRAMAACFRAGGKMLLCGNGGSAADCEHWSAELGEKLQGALPAIPLPAFGSLNSAFANDVDPELAFAQGVWALGEQGDVLVAISTSGNAKNVLRAVEVARARGLVTVGLTGEGGGKLRRLAEICIRAPGREVHRIQQSHLPIYHCLCLMLEDEFFG